MPSVLVLGPSRWLDPEREGSPLEERRRVADCLRRHGAAAVLMEDEQRLAGETNTAFFTRLLRERDVRFFLAYWPLGARLHGLEKELGDLLRWMHDGTLHPRQVVLLAESGTVDQGTTHWALDEPGNRTRYHEDLLAYQVVVRGWDDAASATLHTAALAWGFRTIQAPRWHDALPPLLRPESPAPPR